MHPRGIYATNALAKALGRPVSEQDGLTEYTVVAHWAGLDDHTPDDEHKTWTSAQWAAHLTDPGWLYPSAASPQGDRRAIWHADVLLAPGDRVLTGPEWAEIAHRLARAAGVQTPGDEHGCRWIGVQAKPGRLHLLANLIRPDDTWTRQPRWMAQVLSQECRRIEADLGLTSPQRGPDPAQAARFAARTPAPDTTPLVEPAADTTAQLAQLLHQLADEATGPLATVRGLVEHAAHRLDGLPHAYGPATGHQLEFVARRLYGIQQDLKTTAVALPGTATSTAPSTRAVAAPQTAPARRSR
ncbi:hypothetical protein T261_0838 [Streptomyces lydicus]|nr:hypothetical protein T261_0838 [Streptomyces lydicus]